MHVACEILIALSGGTDRWADFAGSPSGCDKADSVSPPLSQEGFFQSMEHRPVAGGYVGKQRRKEQWIRERDKAHNPLLVDKESPKERNLPSPVPGIPFASSITSLLSLVTTPGDENYCFLLYTWCKTKVNTINSYHVIEYKMILNQLSDIKHILFSSMSGLFLSFSFFPISFWCSIFSYSMANWKIPERVIGEISRGVWNKAVIT